MARVSIQLETFDSGVEIDRLVSADLGIGGINTFVGLVRGNNADDDPVISLFLEHYPGMTEKQIEIIIDEAAGRWHILSARVVHRIGLLHPGDPIVFVGVASAHRREAFYACEYIIGAIKTRATLWKKETRLNGKQWLGSRQSDRVLLA